MDLRQADPLFFFLLSVTTEATQKTTTTEVASPAGEKRVEDEPGFGMIIGVAVGAVLFATIAVALVFMLWRKRRYQGTKGDVFMPKAIVIRQ